MASAVSTGDRHQGQGTSASSPTGATPPALDIDTLRERLLTREGGLTATRGSLSKCATRYRDFAELVLSASSSERGHSGTNGGSSSSTADLIESSKSVLERELRLHSLEMRKLLLMSEAAEAELTQYDASEVQIEASISDTKREIEQLKRQLTQEKRVRRNREEYEALAKMANGRPARRHTERKLNEIRSQMEGVRSEERQAMAELDVREKQFHLIVQSIGDLKSSVTEDLRRQQNENEKSRGENDEGGSENAEDGEHAEGSYMEVEDHVGRKRPEESTVMDTTL